MAETACFSRNLFFFFGEGFLCLYFDAIRAVLNIGILFSVIDFCVCVMQCLLILGNKCVAVFVLLVVFFLQYQGRSPEGRPGDF